jgi:hypothetical protein
MGCTYTACTLPGQVKGIESTLVAELAPIAANAAEQRKYEAAGVAVETVGPSRTKRRRHDGMWLGSIVHLLAAMQ